MSGQWLTHRRAGTALVVGAALAVGGCGGSSGGGQAAEQGDTAGLAKAKALVAQASVRPTDVGLAGPVGKAIPTGKKVVFISCGVQACDIQGDILAQGAADLGWTFSKIATDGSPERLQGAFETALRQGADAVILNAVNRATVAKQLAEAQRKGVAFVTCCTVDSTGDGILYNTSTSAQNAKIGEYLAGQVVADGHGKANTLYVNISAFQILKALGTSFERSYKQLCPGCGYASIDIPIASLGKDTPDRIVSYLRSHPQVDHVALSVSNALGAGLPAALQAAGLADKVEIVGQGADTQTYHDLAAGQITAVVPFDYYTVDYLMLDALARHFAGAPIKETAPPLWIMTKGNAPGGTDKLFPVVAGYRDQFKQAWGRG
jgi:ABC-type sugar transport system substrate-binding protein